MTNKLIGLAIGLQMGLIAIKLYGVISWSWLLVLAPSLPFIFVVLFAVAIVYLAGLSVVYKKVKKQLSLKTKSKSK